MIFKKQCRTHTMEFYLIKRNKLLIHANLDWEHKGIIHSEKKSILKV